MFYFLYYLYDMPSSILSVVTFAQLPARCDVLFGNTHYGFYEDTVETQQRN